MLQNFRLGKSCWDDGLWKVVLHKNLHYFRNELWKIIKLLNLNIRWAFSFVFCSFPESVLSFVNDKARLYKQFTTTARYEFHEEEAEPTSWSDWNRSQSVHISAGGYLTRWIRKFGIGHVS